MKSFRYLIIAILGSFAVISCKTTEENYRKAYETAKAKESDGIDETIYNRIRREAKPAQVVIGSDTLSLKKEAVRVSADQDIPQERMKKYNVVVAQFKQLFHAKSMKKRMIEAGYPTAFIVQTREPLYYVVAVTTDDASEAAKALKTFEIDSPIRLVEPCPWVLSPTGR